jgi:hypothetical protein
VTIIVASAPSWTDIVTAIGTVLAGLALPLAFIQLGGLRQDRLRAQVSKVGAWVDTPKTMYPESGLWTIPVRIRNSSELPVRVETVDLTIRPWGYKGVSAAPEGTGEVEYYMDKRFGDTDRTHLAPGTIAPEDTKNIGYPYDKNIGYPYEQKAVFDQPQPLMASITRVVVTDAAGYQWEMWSGKAGPARRVQRWRRWWWKRHSGL